MIAPVSSFRPPHSDGTCEGSDQETGGSFATSRVEDRAERSIPGGATDGPVSLVMPLEGGGEVRFTAVHGRVDMQIRVGKSRSWLTTPVSAERAYQAARRLVTIAHTAAEQRKAKGA